VANPAVLMAESPETAAVVTEDSVRDRAHELWMMRGCPIGSDQQDWFDAELN
jgi:hypothetical protein